MKESGGSYGGGHRPPLQENRLVCNREMGSFCVLVFGDFWRFIRCTLGIMPVLRWVRFVDFNICTRWSWRKLAQEWIMAPARFRSAPFSKYCGCL